MCVCACVWVSVWVCMCECICVKYINVNVFGRYLHFVIKIGNHVDQIGCRKPVSRRESVIVDYSTNNGLSWSLLKLLDPESLNEEAKAIYIQLPTDAKTSDTKFRWWQSLIDNKGTIRNFSLLVCSFKFLSSIRPIIRRSSCELKLLFTSIRLSVSV